MNKKNEDEELEDELDRIAAIKQREEAQRKLKFDLQSSVVKKSLPQPIKFVPESYKPSDQIEELIYREMQTLIKRDVTRRDQNLDLRPE